MLPTPLMLTTLPLHAMVLFSLIPETLTRSPGAGCSTVAAEVEGTDGAAVSVGADGRLDGVKGPPPPEMPGGVGVLMVERVLVSRLPATMAPPPTNSPTTNSPSRIQPTRKPDEEDWGGAGGGIGGP